MKKTLLFGGSGFFGPVILSKNPEIISVGRTLPPKECKNKHIQLNNLDEINKLDKIDLKLILIIKKRTNLVNEVIKLKKNKNEIVDKKRIKFILDKIRKKSIKLKIDPIITVSIWKEMIKSFIKYEYKKFKK